MKKLMTILLMRTIMKNTLMTIFTILLAVGFISVNAKAGESETIATFEDPSGNSNNPLFTVVFATSTINGYIRGGWSGDGLTLEIPYNTSSPSFDNVWFFMPDVTIYSDGATGHGTIKFFEDGDPVTATPLVEINFDSGFVSRFGFGAENEFVAENVTIASSKIIGTFLDEQFSFSFVNKKKLAGQPNQIAGFTATAAFTSSAVIPEPATICILSLGALSLIRRKK